MNRRVFLQTSATAALSGNLGAAAPARQRAPYRVVYSNDTTNILSCASPYHRRGEPFRAAMLEASVDEVAGLVDAHFLQPGLGVVPMWPSKVLPLEEHYAWIRERYGRGPDSFGQFVLNGGDVVRVFIDRCRARGQAPFLSLRLNDAHHKEFTEPRPGVRPDGSIGMSVTRFYAEHPELRIKPGSLRGPDLVLNWAEPVVREHKLAMIRELCENYDLDGFELDFLRFPSFFRVEQMPVRERCAIQTEFVRQVRQVLDRTAHPMRRRWLCARVPCQPAALEVIGLDLPALTSAGLDMVNASNYYFTTQQHDLAAIRSRTAGATLYFELCHTLWNGEKVAAAYDAFPFRRATREHLHTTAHQAYARGADGISLFNFVYYREHGSGEGRGSFGEPPFDALADLRDPEKLARAPQHWFLAKAWRGPGMRPLPLPRPLEPGKPARFTLDLAPPRGGWLRPGRLRVQADAAIARGDWSARFNGIPLEASPDVSEPFPVPYPCLLGKPGELGAWEVPASLLRDGKNAVEFTLTSGRAVVRFVDLAVK